MSELFGNHIVGFLMTCLFSEMSLPESVQAFNDQITDTMNNDIPSGAVHEALSPETMVTSMANQQHGNIDGESKQSKLNFRLFMHNCFPETTNATENILYEPGHEKTNNVVSEQVQHKRSCSRTEVG